jgi:hypothetical protein
VNEREAARPSTVDDPAPVAAIPAQRTPIHDEPVERMSRLALVMVALVVVAAAGWLFMSWLVLDSPLIDAIGETVGSVALGLVLVSILGALRRSRR